VASALLRALPPVGSSVPLFVDAQASIPDLTFKGAYEPVLLDSGTSALSLALGFARKRNRKKGQTALLPAYGCPDLVAAAAFAGVQPQLVDVERDTPWLSLDGTTRVVDSAMAVVAVNFLGMPERLDSLREIANAAGLTLIEDSAQMAPFSADTPPRGDLVVYSFGRGKPLSLLTGGMLLIRRDWLDEFQKFSSALPRARRFPAGYLLKCAAYNIATHPAIFAWARRIPLLQLGQVTYSELQRIEAMPAAAFARLGSGFAKLPHTPSEVQRALDAQLRTRCPLIVNLPAQLGRTNFPLLRYPLLARNSSQRDALVERLDDAGLGASRFYGRALAEIPGVPSLDNARTPCASEFAGRLFTLPVHSDVRLRDVDAMIAALAQEP
jgi:dTDP-4-amino-4,6-dideoxygalactose transaminase